MNSFKDRFVVVVAVLIACGILMADDPTQQCELGCDCDTPKSSTSPCATSLTICEGVEPECTMQEVEGEMVEVCTCSSAWHIEPDWSSGCKSNTSVNENGETVFYNTNCSLENKDCRHTVECVYDSGCKEKVDDPEVGNWILEKKPIHEGCPGV